MSILQKILELNKASRTLHHVHQILQNLRRQIMWQFMDLDSEALFSSEKWKDFGTVALSFVYDKYYPIID